jgi:selenocysteine lyase/cysteine desulfurase
MRDQDVAALRADTPGYLTGLCHLNNAGASLPARPTLEAIGRHLQFEAENGVMEAAAAATPVIEAARADAARLLNAETDEIAFCPGNSAGYGRAIAALPRWQPGDRIFVSRQEWGGNLALLHRRAAECGASIETIPVLPDGSTDAEALATRIDSRVKLVTLTWAPANGGLVNDAAAIGRVLNGTDIPYVIDAAQAVGQMAVDVKALNCDVLMAPGRKYLRGPRAVGLIHISRRLLPHLTPAYVDAFSAPWGKDGPVLRQDARLLESAEQPTALLTGFAEALKQAASLDMTAVRNRIRQLADFLRDELSKLPGVSLQDIGNPATRSGLVSFTMKGRSLAEVQKFLAGHRITIGGNGTAYTPLDMEARNLSEIMRASVTYLTMPEEVERLCRALRELA